MLRLEENTPSIYTEESRDFQLFCRLYDSVINSTKFDIDTIPNILDPMLINDKLLDLMCTKVGFYPKYELNSNTLRYILSVFPYLIKRKGSKQGIEGALNCMLNIEHTFGATIDVDIDTKDCIINIRCDKDIKDKRAFNELLKYLTPVGYTYNLNIVLIKKGADFTDTLNVEDTKENYTSTTYENSVIVGSNFTPSGDLKYKGTVQGTQIQGSKTINPSEVNN